MKERNKEILNDPESKKSIITLAVIGLVTLVLLCVLFPAKVKLDKMFIVPTEEEVYKQEDREYLIINYSESLETMKFIKAMRGNDDFGVYLIDSVKYPSVYDDPSTSAVEGLGFNLTYALNDIPQYIYMSASAEDATENKRERVFNGSGYYCSENIKIQANFILKNGLPINEIGVTKDIDGNSIRFTKITTDGNKVLASLVVTNNSGKDLTLKASDFSLYSSTNGNKHKIVKEQEFSIGEGKVDTITIEFEKDYDSKVFDSNWLEISIEGYGEKEWSIHRPELLDAC